MVPIASKRKPGYSQHNTVGTERRKQIRVLSENTEQLRRLTVGALNVAGCKIHDSTAVSFDLSEVESQEVMTGKRNL